MVGRFWPCGSLGSIVHQLTEAADDLRESMVSPSLTLSSTLEDRREPPSPRSVALEAWKTSRRGRCYRQVNPAFSLVLSGAFPLSGRGFEEK